MPKAEMHLESSSLRCLDCFDLDVLGPALSTLFGAELNGVGPLVGAPSELTELLSTPRFDLETEHGIVSLFVEPELVSALLSRLLDRPVTIEDARLPLDETLRGAGRAIVLELGRRLTREAPPTLLALGSSPLGPAWTTMFWLRIDARSYRGALQVRPNAIVHTPGTGDIPVPLPLVIGQGILPRDEFESLTTGDAWLLGEDLWVDTSINGRAVAIAGSLELGFQLQLHDNGIEVHGLCPLLHEPPHEERSMDDNTAESAVFEAPVIVRVEVGSITLSAREWMALTPGDVLSTSRPTGSAVTLRVAGAEVAQGELVTVDGEIGVRITRVVGRRRGNEPPISTRVTVPDRSRPDRSKG